MAALGLLGNGGGEINPDLQIEGASCAASTLHRAHLSSVWLITDASGNAEQSTPDTPFGDPDTQTLQPTSTPEERSFIGERFDASTGLL